MDQEYNILDEEFNEIEEPDYDLRENDDYDVEYFGVDPAFGSWDDYYKYKFG